MSSILLAHAATDDRELYAEALRARGYHVIEASSTDDALASMASTDLLITGLVVPGTLTSIELIARAKQERPSRPVVVLTASIVAAQHRAAEAAGAAAILLKPCYPAELMAVIERVLHEQETGALARVSNP